MHYKKLTQILRLGSLKQILIHVENILIIIAHTSNNRLFNLFRNNSLKQNMEGFFALLHIYIVYCQRRLERVKSCKKS